MKRKILEVYSLTVRGGAETLIMNHLRVMNRQEFQVDFVNHTTEVCDYDDEIRSLDCHLYHMPKFRILYIISYITAWFSFFKKHPDYDVIHVHYFTLAPIIIPIAKICGVKVRITHSHINKKASFYKRLLLNITNRIVVKDSTQLLACSNEAGKNIFHTDNFVIFKNAIPSSLFVYNVDFRENIRAEYGIENDTFIIGHVGSFRSLQKNHSFIIDVFYELHKLLPNSKLMLVGEGKLRVDMEKKVRCLELADSVIFTGVRQDTYRYYQAMDLFLFPSLYEGLGIVAIEAQVAGLPVLLSTEVPHEAYISDLVVALPLKSAITKWVDTIINMSKWQFDRSKYHNVAIQNGYDIKNNIRILETIYSN